MSSPYFPFKQSKLKEQFIVDIVLSDDVSKVDNIKMCCVCQEEIPSEDFLDKVYKDYEKRFLYLEKKDKSICINCMQYFLQITREQEKANLLLTYCIQTLSSVDREWDYGSSVTIENASIFKNCLARKYRMINYILP